MRSWRSSFQAEQACAALGSHCQELTRHWLKLGDQISTIQVLWKLENIFWHAFEPIFPKPTGCKPAWIAVDSYSYSSRSLKQPSCFQSYQSPNPSQALTQFRIFNFWLTFLFREGSMKRVTCMEWFISWQWLISGIAVWLWPFPGQLWHSVNLIGLFQCSYPDDVTPRIVAFLIKHCFVALPIKLVSKTMHYSTYEDHCAFWAAWPFKGASLIRIQLNGHPQLQNNSF